MVNSMPLNSTLSLNLWVEFLYTACHIQNSVRSRNFKVLPYQLWKNSKKLNLNTLIAWACIAFNKILDSYKNKLGSRGMKSTFFFMSAQILKHINC